MRQKTGNVLFFTGLTIELLILLVDKSALTNPVEGRLFQLTFLIFAVKVCMTRYTVKEWAIIALFEILGVISYLVTGRNEIIRIVTMIAACRDTGERAIFSYMFKVVLTGCLLIISLSVSGVLGAVKLTGIFRGDVEETRYCLGMGHPNSLHCMFFMLVLLFLYLYGKKIRWYGYIPLFLLNFGVFFLTGSKTGMMVTAFAVAAALVLACSERLRREKFIYGISAFLLMCCAAVAWLAAALSERILFHEGIRKFDRLLSDRIFNLYYDSASHAGTLPTWRWLGVPENEYYFDLGWVRLFYWYGILPACVFILVLLLLIRELYREKEYMGIVLLSSLFIYTLVEAHIVSVYLARDYSLFMIGARFGTMFGADQGKNGYFFQAPAMLLMGGVS